MKRIIRIEIRFDDGREERQRVRPEAKQEEVAAKAAASAALRSAGMKVTETSSSTSTALRLRCGGRGGRSRRTDGASVLGPAMFISASRASRRRCPRLRGTVRWQAARLA